MVEQGSDEWKKMRLGKATASRMADICAKTKTGYGASRYQYKAQLVAERLTDQLIDIYTNAAMAHGTATEPEARAAYEFHANVTVQQTDFVPHETIAQAGASPDGLIGADGLVEIKCPTTATHIETLLGREVPGKYVLQIQWQLECCNRKWCDFVSYDPRMREDMRLFIKRVHRDDKKIAELRTEVTQFLAEVDATVAQLLQLYAQPLAA